MLNIRKLSANAEGFKAELEALLAWETVSNDSVNEIVKDVLKNVRERGDEALLEYTAKFDRLTLAKGSDLEIPKSELEAALKRIPQDQREGLELSAQRVKAYHEKQVMKSWSYTEDDGTFLGQQVTCLDRVGLYVPGGKAAYPSSVIMNAIPAKVAGVPELIMVVPTPDGEVNDMVLAAAAICGVDRVFTLGGAQAVAALAYGTETVPPVDKVVGPGNIFVATAKREVYGTVGIDMIAGPSEILVYCDGKTNPDWIAMDLFSQAEHDEDAQSILVTQDAEFAEKVYLSMNKLVKTLPREEIITKAITDRGAIIVVDNEDQAIEMINYIAPEHLELSVDEPKALLPKIKHAGAIFMGRYTAEALGDYCAGPNHVLPTSRTARFSSPLGVYDFQKRSSLIMCSAEGANMLGQVAGVLADGEGLQAHAASARYRVKD
ncbi:Histidinol dehydrogenase [Hydrogenovibrio crunogenus]|uniref:Histidinol dehydrogenase n=1 Tax=Hydrogenovibrio crunogenus TaxID=39765 RepID=A0A4P7P1B0_9GAMM|nr:histidinol dehydrogenase [Hydrogenovibrio crunogenus]QBZ83012.1 Histidinol dehydrogenase [Hydrogenovibrio crunogenus]RUM91342.1 MAG: histidinol dehydrogenase [Thiomicrospira sp.]